MKLINLTPHELVVRKDNGFEAFFPPSGEVARVEVTQFSVGRVMGTESSHYPGNMGDLDVVRNEFGPVEGLPAPDPEGTTGYLVSSLVLSHPDVAGRDDVFAPDTGSTAVRNDQGQVVAVRRLVCAPYSID